MVNVVENTLRDGSYVVDFQFSGKQTGEIVSGFDQLGFDYIEIGHGLGLGAWNNPKTGLAKESDETYMQAARDNSRRAKIGVFFIPGIGSYEDIDKAQELGVNFIRIGINIDDYALTKPFAEYAKNKGMMVCVNLMKSYAVKSYEFSHIVKQIDDWGIADVIYLVDSAGCMMPNEVFEYLDRSKELIKTNLGFHGHNNLMLGIANSMQAVQAGATFIDTCTLGMGRSAGNAQTEIFVHVLNTLGLNHKNIDLYALYDFANQYIQPLMPSKQGLSDVDIHIGVSKFHTSYMKYVSEASLEHNVESRKLIKEVSDVNCLNPEEELFYKIAAELNDGK